MEKKLQVSIGRDIEVGSCFVKVLEVLFRYYGFDLKTYSIEGISECLEVLYSKCDFENEIEPKIFVNKSSEIQNALNTKLPVHLQREHFNTYEEGIHYVKKEIDNGRPVCIAVNTYYLNYSDDYHTKYGGLFKNYHMLIVKGYSDENNQVYVVDPALFKDDESIPYDELKSAWDDGTGIEREYHPYVYYDFKIEQPIENLKDIIFQSFVSNLSNFFTDTKCNRCGIEFQRGIVGLQEICDDLKKLSKYDLNDAFREKAIDSIYQGGFHLIRYTRLDFQLYFNEYFGNEIFPELSVLFDKWTEFLTKLAIVTRLRKYENVFKCAEQLQEIINFEKELFQRIDDFCKEKQSSKNFKEEK